MTMFWAFCLIFVALLYEDLYGGRSRSDDAER